MPRGLVGLVVDGPARAPDPRRDKAAGPMGPRLGRLIPRYQAVATASAATLATSAASVA